MATNNRIRALLEFLYGAAAAAEIEGQLRSRLTGPAGGPGQPRAEGQPARVDERDVLLITYPDQLRAAGEAPLGTLERFCRDWFGDLISGVHLLPFYPSSSDDGFAVQDYEAVEPAFGTWADVARFGPRFDLMFDAVFNHLSASSDWFHRFCRDEPGFRDFFVTVTGAPDLSAVVRPRALPLLTEFPTARGPERVWTTFSADQVDLNFRNPRVLLAITDVLLGYVRRGARFIRLDAIAFLWKEPGTSCLHRPQTHAVIQLFRAVLDEVAPGVLLITETNVPHADNLSYFGDGTNEAQLVYNFALPPLVLHALATGQASTLTAWAATLRAPSPRTTFFNFLASHDGIGLNPARGILTDGEVEALVARCRAHGGLVSFKYNPDGTRSPYELNVSLFDAVNDPAAPEPLDAQIARFRVAHAILLALAGVPGLYFHSLVGSRNDAAGAATSGMPRRINREKFDCTLLEAELADPRSRRARVLAAQRALLRVRRAHAAFHPTGPQRVLELDRRVFALERTSPDGAQRVLCLQNVSNETVCVPLDGQALETRWPLLEQVPGTPPSRSSGSGTSAILEPYGVQWLSSEPRSTARSTTVGYDDASD